MIDPNFFERKVLSATDFYRSFGDEFKYDGRFSSSAMLAALLMYLDDETIGKFYNDENGPFKGLTKEH